MNYNYLRYFSVLAQVEHYTLAAARLGISQPSLSSAIHNLEAELGGVKLFEKVMKLSSDIKLRYTNNRITFMIPKRKNWITTVNELMNIAEKAERKAE